MKEYIINLDTQNIRLDKVITMLNPELSRSMIQKMLDDGNILVNGKQEKASYKTKLNDKIEVEEVIAKEIEIKAQDIPVDVIYEDTDIIVVNKPKGMVVHPANGNPDGTLVNAIMNICKDSLSGIGGEIRPGIVHRIDKDTSGLLIIAKNDKAHINLSEQIKNREITKKYVALARGVIKENNATIDMPIGVRKDGKNAVTHFEVIKRYNGYTYLDIKIDTGRTHQIRVHLAEIGYPIVGDGVYSNGKNPFGVEGQMLHAKSLEFKHPKTGETLKLEAPLPEYFEEVLNELEKIVL